MGRPEKIRLGDLLIAQKIISQEQLRIALEQQKKTGRRLGRVLVEQGYTNDEQICEAAVHDRLVFEKTPLQRLVQTCDLRSHRLDRVDSLFAEKNGGC